MPGGEGSYSGLHVVFITFRVLGGAAHSPCVGSLEASPHLLEPADLHELFYSTITYSFSRTHSASAHGGNG